MILIAKLNADPICFGAIHKLRSQARGEGGLAKWLQKLRRGLGGQPNDYVDIFEDLILRT